MKSEFLYAVSNIALCTALLGLGAGCSGDNSAGVSSTHHIKTVFIILMENKAWSEVAASPSASYLVGTILPQAARAENYKGPNNGNLHPSEPNYIWLEAGDNLGVINDNDPVDNHQSTTDHLVTYMKQAGVSWKSYQEDITGDVCPLSSVGDYRPKHDPMVFFDDATDTNDAQSQYCIDHNRPLTELETDLASGTVAKYNFIVPNQCNDMHSACAPLNDMIAQGDAWLAQWIPKILASPQYLDDGALFITWDEATFFTPTPEQQDAGVAGCPLANCPIGMIMLSPLGKGGGYQNSIAYDHSSMLKTVQEIFHIEPLLRAAGNPATNDLADLFKSFP